MQVTVWRNSLGAHSENVSEAESGAAFGLTQEAVHISPYQSRLPDGKIWSPPFLGLRQGGGRGGAIQGKNGINFCSVA